MSDVLPAFSFTPPRQATGGGLSAVGNTTPFFAPTSLEGAIDDLAKEVHVDPAEVLRSIRESITGSPPLPHGRGAGPQQHPHGAHISIGHDDSCSRDRFQDDTELVFSSAEGEGIQAAATGAEHRRLLSPGQSIQSFLSVQSRDSQRTRTTTDDPQLGSSVQSSAQSLIATLESGRRSAHRRKVQFANHVGNVIVYEADSSLWVELHFQRNKFGWVMILFAVVVFIAWDFYLEELPEDVDWDMLFVSAAYFKLICAVGLVGCGAFSGLNDFSIKLFLELRHRSVAVPIVLLAAMLSLHELLKSVAESLNRKAVPLFGPAAAFSLIFLPLLRALLGRPTFRIEWVSSVVLVGASFAAVTPMFNPQHHMWTVFASNALHLASSFVWAVAFLFLERSQRATDSILLRLLPAEVFSIVWNTVYTWCIGRLRMEVLFTPQSFWHVAVAGSGSLLLFVLYFIIVRHVDIQSLGAVFALKAIASPYLERLMIQRSNFMFWNPWFWAATPVVVVASVVIVYFASARRSFVARRLDVGNSSG